TFAPVDASVWARLDVTQPPQENPMMATAAPPMAMPQMGRLVSTGVFMAAPFAESAHGIPGAGPRRASHGDEPNVDGPRAPVCALAHEAPALFKPRSSPSASRARHARAWCGTRSSARARARP